MLRPNHLDNFGTNLTSGTSASDTTSPVNSVPSIAAPFWVAFDATNINSHYERKLITSKTATNILHSALAYDHTTAEEVRIVNPSEEFDAIYQPPQGFLINGKIVVTDASGITVAIKTLAGADPSETDPVHVRIGDSVHTLTSALSVSAADGTNWFNSGGSALATNAVDYFAYLGYNATDGVVIGFAKVPGVRQYGSFSATTTNDRFCKISTITTAASTDYYEVVGRFQATLSAGAGYTWTVPTYEPDNLIQRPIYETRWLSANPTNTITNVSAASCRYKITGNICYVRGEITLSGAPAFNSSNMPLLPISAANEYFGDHVNIGYGGYAESGTSSEPNTLAVVMPSASSNLIYLFTNGGAILSNTVPITWATGDKVYWKCDFEI